MRRSAETASIPLLLFFFETRAVRMVPFVVGHDLLRIPRAIARRPFHQNHAAVSRDCLYSLAVVLLRDARRSNGAVRGGPRLAAHPARDSAQALPPKPCGGQQT